MQLVGQYPIKKNLVWPKNFSAQFRRKILSFGTEVIITHFLWPCSIITLCWMLCRTDTVNSPNDQTHSEAAERNCGRYFPEIVHTQLYPILTYSMVQSPSWETNWFEASQEIPHISRNPKVHYRTYKRPPHISILGQSNPVHILTCHLLEIHPNIIHPSTPRSPLWSTSRRFPHQDPIPPSPNPYAPHPIKEIHFKDICFNFSHIQANILCFIRVLF